MPAYSAIVDDAANNRQIDLPAGGWIAGTLSTTAAQGLTAAQQAQAQGNIGLAPTGAASSRASANDVSANGSYFNPAAVALTATGTKMTVAGFVAFNHQNATLTNFYAYVDLYDNTAGSVTATGIALQAQLSSSTIQLGSMSPGVTVSGLIPGHSYIARLWIQRNAGNGPTSYNCDVEVENV